MLTLRPATLLDLPPLALLMQDHQHKYLNDFEEYDLRLIQQIIQAGEVLAIDDYGYPVGCAWFHDRLDDLHATISLIIQPAYLRPALRDGVFPKILNYAFTTLHLGKIKATPMAVETTAIKLLEAFGFQKLCVLRGETRYQERVMDVLLYEMYAVDWETNKRESSYRTLVY